MVERDVFIRERCLFRVRCLYYREVSAFVWSETFVLKGVQAKMYMI